MAGARQSVSEFCSFGEPADEPSPLRYHLRAALGAYLNWGGDATPCEHNLMAQLFQSRTFAHPVGRVGEMPAPIRRIVLIGGAASLIALISIFLQRTADESAIRNTESIITTADAVKLIPTFVDGNKVLSLELHSVTVISPDTKKFRFRLPSDGHITGLRPGDHVKMSANINGMNIERKYTHVSTDELRGIIEFVVKIYRSNVHPDFPRGGKFTPHLESVPIGGLVSFAGPVGRVYYKGNGHFSVKDKETGEITYPHFTKLGLIAGGSGITPIWQVLNAVLSDPNDPTELQLLFANRTPADVLLKEELDALAAAHPKRLKVWYTVSNGDADWKYSTGYITEQMLAKHAPSAHASHGAVICGPRPMNQQAVIPNLEKLGYTKAQIVVF